MRKVSFQSHGARLDGRLHLSASPPHPLPGIVVVGSWLTVKEQMPARYAPLVAARGMAALTFDFDGFGESEGQPREVESPHRKAENIRDAALYLSTVDGVDPQRIGVLAICASAGYTALATLDEPVIKSVAMAAPWLHDLALVRELYEGKAGVAERVQKARAARRAYVATGKVDYVPAASNVDATAAMYLPGDALDYYLNPARGAVPEWGGRFAVMAWQEWLDFDPIALAPRMRVPIRIVTSKDSATPAGAERFAAGLPSPPDLVWTTGTQFDFYDRPATLQFVVDQAVEHFIKTL